MTESPSNPDFSLRLARRIDEVCNRFEADWRNGNRPRVEEYLGEWSGEERVALLQELVVLDLFYRREAGESPRVEEYRSRFDDFEDSWFEQESLDRTHAETPTPSRGVDTTLAGESGFVVGDYELLGEIARGGMGIVYRARQRSLDRLVALKRIRAGRLASEEEVSRFRREAEAAAALDHPNIVPIYEVGEHEDQPYFSMKLIEGGALDFQKRTGDYDDIARIVELAARAVHHAHQRGILHRDLKPSNILVDEQGQPYVTDFGLAKRIEHHSELTRSGILVGTPSYMAPEQATAGKEVTTRSDVYSLGAVLYALLTGKPPFESDSVLDTLVRVREHEPDPPRKIVAGVPRDLETICLKCLEKEPSKRYGSAEELAEELGRYRSGEPIRARPTGGLERLVKWSKRNPGIVALLSLALSAILIGSATATYFGLDAVREAKRARDSERTANESKSTAERLAKAERAANLFAQQKAKLAEDRARAEAAAKALAQQQTTLAKERLLDAETLAYANTLARVQLEWDNGNRLQALKLLDSCPWHLRGWEYDFLWSQYHSRKTLPGPASALGVHPKGEWLATNAVLWNLTTNQPTPLPKKNTTRSLCVHPQGHLLAFDELRNILLWNPATGETVHELTGHRSTISCLAFSPNGEILASASADGTIKLWSVENGQPLHSIRARVRSNFALDFDPEGKVLAASCTGAVQFWDVKTATKSSVYPEIPRPTLGVRFSPDGKHLGVVDSKKQVSLWDLEASKPIRTLTTLVSQPTGLEFSSDGSLLACCSNSNPVLRETGGAWVWDLETGREVLSLQGRVRGVNEVAFHPDGRTLLTASPDGVKFWDIPDPPTDSPRVGPAPSGGILKPPRGSRTARVRHDPTGRYVATLGQGKFRLLDSRTREEKAAPDASSLRLRTFMFSADGNRIYFGCSDGRVLGWGISKNKQLFDRKIAPATVPRLALSPDGKRLAAGVALFKATKLLDAETGQDALEGEAALRAELEGALGPDSRWLVMEPDGSRSVCHLPSPSKQGRRGAQKVWRVTKASDGSIRLRDPSGKTSPRIFEGHSERATSVCFTPDGRRTISASLDQTVRVWDLKTGRELLTLPRFSGPVGSVSLRSDGGQLVTGSSPGRVRFWDSSRRPKFHSLSSGGKTSRLSVARDGSRVATIDGSFARCWDTITAQKVTSAVCRGEYFTAVACSPDGSLFATATKRGAIDIWSSDTGECVATLERKEARNVASLAFSPDGKRLASGAWPEHGRPAIHVWDLATGEPARILSGHTRQIEALDFSPDGSRLASSSGDSTIRIWDTETGECLHTLLARTGGRQLSLGPGGKLLVSCGRNQRVQLWNAESGEFLRTLEGPQAEGILSADFDASGRRLITGSLDRLVRVWDLRTDKVTHSFVGHSHHVTTVTGLDSRRILAGSNDGRIIVFPLPKERPPDP